ncbi:MAG: restriction endonuclease fold toxin 5 domain-containing protein, partial [Planctomycetaceae bacterium]|nr:restriction endonuclease fold toxin 5 domain-containing protein [Planctomycetaceae bacterium]
DTICTCGDNIETTNTESWKQLSGTIERTDYIVEDNEWIIDDETETIVDLLEYLYNDESATIPSIYRTINVDNQTYDDFEDYFASLANNSSNSLTSAINYSGNVAAFAGTSSNNQSNNSNEPPNSNKLSAKPDNPLGQRYAELWDQLWDNMSDDEKQRMKELIGWGWKFEFYNMYNSYDISLNRRTIYIDYRHFTLTAWTNEQLIATIKTAINDSLLPTMKYTIADVLEAYKVIFGANEPLLQVYQSDYPNGVGADNIIEVVPLKGNEKISGGIAWRTWSERMTGTPDHYVIRISDQCRDVLEAAILLYNALDKSKTSDPMQTRILAQGDVDLYWGMSQAVFEQRVVPALQNFATAMQTCAAVAYEPIDWAIAISEAVEKKDPTYLAVAAVPFVPATVVNTVKTAKKITKGIKGGINVGDTLPSGIGSVVKVNRGGNSPESIQYQFQITGFPYDHEYALKYSKSNSHSKTVDFDGAKVEKIDGVDMEIFVEAKGKGYANLFNASFGQKKLDEWIEQATRQVEAILENGVAIDLAKHKPLEWHCAEFDAAKMFRDRLNSNKPTEQIILSNGCNLRDYIQVIHTDFIP